MNKKWTLVLVILICLILPSGYSQRKLPQTPVSRCEETQEIVGTWKWFNGWTVLIDGDNKLRSFSKNGNQGAGRMEKLADGRYRLVWGKNTWIDVLELKSGGNYLEGVNQKGTKVSATKISSAIDEELKNLPPYNLSGIWVTKNSTDEARYYLNQSGKTVYWFGESQTESPVWAHVLIGTIQDDEIIANYSDIPKGKNRCVGDLKFKILKPDEIFLYESSGGWPSQITYIKEPKKNSRRDISVEKKENQSSNIPQKNP